MNIFYCTTLFILFFNLSNGQISNDCFSDANYQRNMDLKEGKDLKVGDNADQIVNSVETALAKIIGCKFPYSPFRTTTDKELTFDKIKTDFIIINFNYLFCDHCINQLDSLVKIKKESKKTLTIVSFFACSKKDIKHLIEKFKNEVVFVTDSENYTKNYDFGAGQPLNYILDKNKKIIYANRNISIIANLNLVN